MPNWCTNSITIEGPKEKIETLWKDAHKEDSGLLNALVPLETTEENWYVNQIDNWGTKWEVDVSDLELYENTITGNFQSAWEPPLEAIKTYLENNPDVSIELYYEEEGLDFAGQYINGEEYYVEEVSTIARKIQKEEMLEEDAPEDFQILNWMFDFLGRDYSYYEDEEE